MALAKPTDEEWLAFRRKHDIELNEFQKQVQAAKVKFHDNVQKGRAEILARHEKEEKEYWTKRNDASNNSVANKPTSSKVGAKGQVNGKATASVETPVPHPTQTPASSSKASQTPKPAQARSSPATPAQSSTATPATRPANKKTAVTYINLCSDDDDDEPVVGRKRSAPTKTHDAQPPQTKASSTTVSLATRQDPPAYTIPSANLTLFGNTSNTFGVREQLIIYVGVTLNVARVLQSLRASSGNIQLRQPRMITADMMLLQRPHSRLLKLHSGLINVDLTLNYLQAPSHSQILSAGVHRGIALCHRISHSMHLRQLRQMFQTTLRRQRVLLTRTHNRVRRL
jgi:hypothetical protein